MKIKFKKAACFVLSVMMLLVFSSTGFAVDTVTTVSGHTPHEGDEACVYSCILEEVPSSRSDELLHEHLPHEGDEKCIYSCNHEINCSKWSEQKVSSFLEEYKNVSSDDEMISLMSKYYNLSKEDIIPLFDTTVDVQSEKGSLPPGYYDCDHSYIALDCNGEHRYGTGANCVVWCTRQAFCEYYCGSTITVVVKEIHDWSVGWCGQTCKNCGVIEKFHEEGGCRYCS